ncbi:hypothetical protein IWZ00DRAFT_318415 [Phyllosticta capitalensis]|uniref:Uncharacterized protein n=1 Tax=Phyllosticta capitalensis TaxID=121624 RepID=A0ABR1YL43_9PEZI
MATGQPGAACRRSAQRQRFLWNRNHVGVEERVVDFPLIARKSRQSQRRGREVARRRAGGLGWLLWRALIGAAETGGPSTHHLRFHFISRDSADTQQIQEKEKGRRRENVETRQNFWCRGGSAYYKGHVLVAAVPLPTITTAALPAWYTKVLSPSVEPPRAAEDSQQSQSHLHSPKTCKGGSQGSRVSPSVRQVSQSRPSQPTL